MSEHVFVGGPLGGTKVTIEQPTTRLDIPYISEPCLVPDCNCFGDIETAYYMRRGPLYVVCAE